MSIKKYNESKKCWEVIGSANASEIELTNPEYAKEDGTPSSVSEAFDKISNRIENIEKNVSYIYKNGTIGGGGGGGGGGGSTTDEIIVTNEEVSTVSGRNFLYISGNSLSINFYVKTLGASGKYIVTATYGGKTITGWRETTVYSSKNGSTVQSITLTDIVDEKSLEIYAVSANGTELEKYTLYVRINAYSFDIDSRPNATISINYNEIDSASSDIVYIVKDGIPNTTMTLQIRLGNQTTTEIMEGKSDGVTYYCRYKLRDLFKSIEPEVGREYTLTAFLQIAGPSLIEPIQSAAIVRTISIADATALVVQCSSDYLILVENLPNDNIHTEDEVKNKLTQTDKLTVNVNIIDNNFSTFRVAYRFLADDKVTEIGRVGDPTKFDGEGNDTMTAGSAKSPKFELSSLFVPGQSISYTGLYYFEIYVWAASNPENRKQVKTYIGRIEESQFITVYDYFPNNRLVCQYNAYLNLPSNSVSSQWIAQRDNKGPLFSGNSGEFAAAQVMRIFDTNNITSGFLYNEYVDSINCLRLAGGAAGMIPFQPFKRLGSDTYQNVLTSSLGWTISITFKSDIHPSKNRTILDIGDYLFDANSNDYVLTSGYQISLGEAVFKFKDGDSTYQISTKLIQGRVNVVDLVFEAGAGSKSANLKLYLNGVCSAARFFDHNDYNTINMVSNSFVWFGGRQVMSSDQKNLDQTCDVNIYDFKIVAEALNPYGICRNYINSISRVSQSMDITLVNTLRANNLMTAVVDEATKVATLDCAICNIDSGQYVFDESWAGVYDRLVKNSPIPIVYIELTGGEFFQTYDKIYNTSETDILDTKFPCIIKYTEPGGGKTIEITTNTGSPQGSSGQSEGTTPEVSLQGTTTLGYSSKNLEIYFGTYDGTNQRLFTPQKPKVNGDGQATGWLPEYRFTLKSDVVDSAHCNNASIGKFINNSGIFNRIPPQEDSRNPYANYVKHTLEGFPVYLFIKYSFADQGANDYFQKNGLDITIPQFMGIYSFNLGRGSYFNLGFRAFRDVALEYTDAGGESGVVSNFVDLIQPVSSYGNGIYSYECNANNNIYGSFQSDDEIIIRKLYDLKYSPDDQEGDSFSSFKMLFTLFANCYLEQTEAPIYVGKLDDMGNLGVSIKTNPDGSTVYYGSDYLKGGGLELIEKKIHYENAIAYFLTAMAFGMVDSLGKNMTLRCYTINGQEVDITGGNLKKWYTSFYDMDTCLGLNNFGDQVIKKNVYLNKFENIIDEENDFTTLKEIRNFDSESTGYSTFNSRLWNTLTYMLRLRDGNIIQNRRDFRDMWVNWRNNESIFLDYTNFINNYYNNQTNGVGEIIYNLDYQVKYFKPYDTKDSITGDRKDKNSITFLHGQRKEFVEDWFKDRLQFLDAAFLYNWELTKNIKIPNSDYLLSTSVFASGSNGGKDTIELGLVLPGPNIFYFNVNQENIKAYIEEETLTKVKVKGASGVSQVAFNLAQKLSTINNFKAVNWSNLNGFVASNLTELDLSNTTALTGPEAVGEGEGANIFYRMTELRTLNLRNMKLKEPKTGGAVLLGKSTKIQSIDISGSDFSSVSLPDGGCLEYLNISKSRISSLLVTKQPLLSNIDVTGCNLLQSVEIQGCDSITSINLDNTSVNTVRISDCKNLETIYIRNCSLLNTVFISGLEKIKVVDLSGSTSGISDIDSENITISFTATDSMQTLNMEGWKGNLLYIDTAGKENTNLTNLNLRNSRVYQIQTNAPGVWHPDTVDDYVITDFSLFKGLDRSSRLNLYGNAYIKYLRFPNTRIPSFTLDNRGYYQYMSNITRIFGHIKVATGSAFYFNASVPFKLNDDSVYKNFLVSKGIASEVPVDGNNEAMMDALREAWFAGDQVTNVTFATNSFENLFFTTQNGAYDIYYALSRAKAGGTYALVDVVNLSSFAQGAYGLGSSTSYEHPFGRYTFKYCTSVVSMGSPFCWSTLNGPLFSPDDAFDHNGVFNGLLSPLKSVTGLWSLWNGVSGNNELDNYLYYKIGNDDYLKCTSAACFCGGYSSKSVKRAGKDHTSTPLSSKIFLSYLPNLTDLDSFAHNGSSSVTFNFETGVDKTTGRRVTYFIHNNPRITNVSKAFHDGDEQGAVRITGTITGAIFGGGLVNGTFIDSSDNKSYTFSNTISGYSRFICPKYDENLRLDWTDFNDLFSWQSTNTKNNITNLEYVWGPSTSRWTKNGTNYKGELLVLKTEYTRDNGTKVIFDFPYGIFAELPNITNVSGFFYNHRIYGDYSTDKCAKLPGNMFVGKSRLTTINYLFANPSGGLNFVFNFTSEGFVGCPLASAVGAFQQAGRLGKNDGKYNGIPYKFFYLGNYNSNPIQKINPTTGAKEGTFTRKVLYQTISDMSYCFYGLKTMGGNGSGLGNIQYEADQANFIDTNYKYDPRQYVLSNMNKAYDNRQTVKDDNGSDIVNKDYNPIIENIEYSPKEKNWEEYAWDGIWRDLSALIATYGDPSKVSKIINNFADLTLYNKADANISDNEKSMLYPNYVLPSDIFRYCTPSCNITYSLALLSDYTIGEYSSYWENDSSNPYGYNRIHGRLSPIMFENLTQIISLAGVFQCGSNLITPYKAPQSDGTLGALFDTETFRYNTKCKDISNSFSYIRVRRNVRLCDESLFKYMSDLENIEAAFSWSKWDLADTYYQFNDAFISNTRLKNLKDLFFCNNEGSGVYNQREDKDGSEMCWGPKIVKSSMFPPMLTLNNCDNTFYGVGSATSEKFPALWDMSPKSHSKTFFKTYRYTEGVNSFVCQSGLKDTAGWI